MSVLQFLGAYWSTCTPMRYLWKAQTRLSNRPCSQEALQEVWRGCTSVFICALSTQAVQQLWLHLCFIRVATFRFQAFSLRSSCTLGSEQNWSCWLDLRQLNEQLIDQKVRLLWAFFTTSDVLQIKRLFTCKENNCQINHRKVLVLVDINLA